MLYNFGDNLFYYKIKTNYTNYSETEDFIFSDKNAIELELSWYIKNNNIIGYINFENFKPE